MYPLPSIKLLKYDLENLINDYIEIETENGILYIPKETYLQINGFLRKLNEICKRNNGFCKEINKIKGENIIEEYINKYFFIFQYLNPNVSRNLDKIVEECLEDHKEKIIENLMKIGYIEIVPKNRFEKKLIYLFENYRFLSKFYNFYKKIKEEKIFGFYYPETKSIFIKLKKDDPAFRIILYHEFYTH